MLSILLKSVAVPPLALALWPFYFAAYAVAAFFYTLILSARRAGLWLRVPGLVSVANVMLYGTTSFAAPRAPKVVRFEKGERGNAEG